MSAPDRQERSVTVETAGVQLEGMLGVPDGAGGIVVFAHGSGSSRHSPRNHEVAAAFRGAGLATLLFDLLTAEEDEVDRATREHRFDIGLLGRRVTGAVEWVAGEPGAGHLGVGCFGASTGAAAALVAAAGRRDLVRAVVSRGGRPDLAGAALAGVEAPTLLIVGGEDREVLDLNRRAMAQMTAPAELEVVPGATHLFEEPGAMDQVSGLAARWFTRHL